MQRIYLIRNGYFSTFFRATPVPLNNGMKGIFRHPERYIDLIGKPFVKATQQCSSACKEDPPVDYVSIQFGRCLFKYLQD